MYIATAITYSEPSPS